jgi:hypothetical protein
MATQWTICVTGVGVGLSRPAQLQRYRYATLDS